MRRCAAEPDGPVPLAAGVPAGVRTVGPVDAEATRLVLVRHGEAQCSVDGVVGGPAGCRGLTSVGDTQAAALRDRLLRTGELRRASALYASVLPRATQTARIIAPAVGDGTLPLVEDCGLCELHPGEADGLTWSEFTARYGTPDWDRDPSVPLAPGAESWSGFVTRAAAALRSLAERHRGSQVVVTCHGGVIEAAMLALLPTAAARSRLKLQTANASLTEWELGRFGWRPLRYNDAAHLSEPPPAAARRARTAGPAQQA